MQNLMICARVSAARVQMLRCVSDRSPNTLKLKQDSQAIVSDTLRKLTYHTQDYECVLNYGSTGACMTNSCNGLIAFFNGTNVWLTNPSIMKLSDMLTIATPDDLVVSDDKVSHFHRQECAIGLGYDSPTQEYKLVRMFFREFYSNPDVYNVGCEVLSFGNKLKNLSWKLVKDNPEPSLEIDSRAAPIFVNGALYWTLCTWEHRKAKVRRRFPGRINPEVAVLFNLSEEKFSFLLHPDGIDATDRGYSVIFALGGSVALSVREDFWQITIWILKDHKHSIWEKLYDIDLRGMQCPSQATILPMEVYEDGRKMILLVQTPGARDPGGFLDYYDPIAMRFVKHKKIGDPGLTPALLVAPYNEGTAWPIP